MVDDTLRNTGFCYFPVKNFVFYSKILAYHFLLSLLPPSLSTLKANVRHLIKQAGMEVGKGIVDCSLKYLYLITLLYTSLSKLVPHPKG